MHVYLPKSPPQVSKNAVYSELSTLLRKNYFLSTPRQEGRSLQKGSYPIRESKFLDHFLTISRLVVKNTHFFLDPHFTNLQKEAKDMEPSRSVTERYLAFHNAK